MGKARWLAWLPVVVAVPLFLVTSNVRWAFNSPALYRYGFERFGVSRATGIPPAELERVAREFISYFNDSREWLEVRVPIGGVERPLLNPRELVHMRDVKGLVRGVYLAQEVGLGALLALLVGAGVVGRWRGLRWFAGALLAGAGATVAFVLLAGLALAVAFPWLFYLFHLLSFRNPFWQLDPRVDYLVRLFPQGFWFQATMFVAGATLVEALLLGALAWWARRALPR